MIQNRRYPGTKPFTREQESIFHGRDKEVIQLHQLVSLEPLSVLHGKSGLGKSSLINAGLIPLLEKSSYNCPIPVRFSAWTKGTTESPLDKFIATLQAQKIQTKALDRLMPQENSLWYFAKAQQMAHPKGEHQRLVLLFDQFEELFSYPAEEVEVFKKQLAELLLPKLPERFEQILDIASQRGQEPLSSEEEDRLYDALDIRILFSIRSDRMHLLDQLSDYLPAVLKNNYELQALSEVGAQQALLLPAAMAGDFTSDAFAYTDEASNKIIQFLKDEKTGRVEAIQLQILCASFEEKVIAENIQTFEAHNIGNLTDIISNYYHHQLEKIAIQYQASAARLLEEGLLDKKRQQRLTLHESQIADLYQVSLDILSQLVNYSLLRREPDRREGYTYELSHDTFIKPALAAREKREIKEAKTKQIQQAKELAAEKKKRRRAYILTTLAGILALVSVIALFWALDAQNDALDARDIAQKANNKSDSLLIISNKNLEAAKIAKKEAADAKIFADLQRDTALIQKVRAELLAKKGGLLEKTIASDEDTYNYLLREGQLFLDKGEYRNALTHWANARFLEETPTINNLVAIAEKIVYAEQLFREGDLVPAQKIFEDLLKNEKYPRSPIKTRLTQIKESEETWTKAISGRPISKIENLTLSGNITTIPIEAKKLVRLKKLNIAYNYGEEIFLNALPKTITHLDFEEVRFLTLPSLIFEQKQLTQLIINHASSIFNINPSIRNLTNLKTFIIRNNYQLNKLPSSFGNLTKLDSLVIEDNSKLESLPAFKNLTNLKVLIISGNYQLKNLPLFGKLSNLKTLIISDNDILKNLRESFGNLTKLDSLVINNNSELVKLPNSFGKLTNLKTLEIRNNSQLKSLSSSFGNLINLELLIIENNHKLKKLPNSFGGLVNLKDLSIMNNHELKSLSNSFGNLIKLESLYISNNSLEKLPDSFGNLSSLEWLTITFNDELVKLPDSFGNLTNLKSLYIQKVYKLEKLPDSFGNLINLQSLKIIDNNQLKSLSASFGNLTNLKSLVIDYNVYLESLPDSFGNLSSLKSFYFGKIKNFEKLPNSFGNLANLDSLIIDGINGLKSLPASFGNLANLKTLEIKNTDALENLSDSFGNLTNLKSLDIENNDKLESLPGSFGSLINLNLLGIRRNDLLEKLPDSFGNLSNLKWLGIHGNKSLKTLPQSFENLKNHLRGLYISNTSISAEEIETWRVLLPNTKITVK